MTDPIMALQALLGQQQQEPDPAQFYQGLGQQIDAQQPYQEPIPQGLNPFAAMGSVFAGTLADMLGAKGAQQNAQARVQQRQELPIEAKMRNQQRRADLMHEKELAHLDLKIKIADAKQRAAAKNKEDLKAQQADAEKQRFELQKMKLEQAHEDAQSQRSQETQLKVAEIYAGGKQQTPEDKQIAQDLKTDQAIERLNADLNNIASKPGSVSKAVPATGGFMGSTLGAKPAQEATLTPGGLKQIRAHALSVAKSAGNPRLRDAALSRYLDTLRDPNTGAVDKASPDFMRFAKMVAATIPDAAEQTRLWTEMGLD